MSHVIFETIGWIGTALVITSMMMSSVIKLRIINSLGSVITIIYGICIHALPTVILNITLLAINIFYIIKMERIKKPAYTIINADTLDSCIQYFIKTNASDIKLFFPDFESKLKDAEYVKTVFCKNELIGLTAGIKKDDRLNLIIDYTTSEYRDSSVGKVLYRIIFKEGIKQVVFTDTHNEKDSYFEKVGFKKENGIFVNRG